MGLNVAALLCFITIESSGAQAAGPQALPSATPPETHRFHVFGKAEYRCYAGRDGKKAVDEATKQPCDNKDHASVLIDKIVSIDSKDEPDPVNSEQLAGSWVGKFDFKGRKFEIAMTLFKDPSPVPHRYGVRLTAQHDEPTSRKIAVHTRMSRLEEMNPLSVHFHSAGRNEEIRFVVEVQPSFKK